MCVCVFHFFSTIRCHGWVTCLHVFVDTCCLPLITSLPQALEARALNIVSQYRDADRRHRLGYARCFGPLLWFGDTANNGCRTLPGLRAFSCTGCRAFHVGPVESCMYACNLPHGRDNNADEFPTPLAPQAGSVQLASAKSSACSARVSMYVCACARVSVRCVA